MDKTETIPLTEPQIIEKVLGGQFQLFGLLVQQHWNLAMALALVRCSDPAAAEDIVQESFIKAYCHLSRLRDRSCFLGWLTKIVIQECHSYHRQQMRRAVATSMDIQSLDPRQVVFAAESNPGLTSKQVEFIHSAIRGLPDSFRDVIIMRFIGGLSVKDIALQSGKRYGLVRVRLHRAYKLLRDKLAPVIQEVQS